MNSQTTTQLVQMLVYILIPILIVTFFLIGFLVFLHFKEKNNQKKAENNDTATNNSTNTANKQSIFKFMEFEDVVDSMIVQKNGTRYLMVIGCQGVNYDLMSAVEKNSVEEGFVQFLNTLRNPIQIYIQTRSINLESSLQTYKAKLKEVEDKYKTMSIRYEQMKNSGNYTDEQLQKAYFELTKQSNMCEYGISVIQDTERMSLNKNILNKNYYIIGPYYALEAGNEKMDKEELRSAAFSELYTRCQSIISSISTCGVRGKILRSNELIELLYMAYNRDEAETFGLDKALKAGFNELYSTAPDIYEKRMKELDKEIEEKAMKKARAKVNEAKSDLQKQVEEKQNNMNNIIDEIAKMIIEENEPYIGKKVKDKAIEKLEKNTKEGGNENGESQKTRGRKKSTTI